jgi:hypothetical protein
MAKIELQRDAIMRLIAEGYFPNVHQLALGIGQKDAEVREVVAGRRNALTYVAAMLATVEGWKDPGPEVYGALWEQAKSPTTKAYWRRLAIEAREARDKREKAPGRRGRLTR